MTDNEIIKALECCSRGEDGCDECPLILCDCVSPILTMERLMRDALDLINRQKAEIERLKAESAMADGYADALEERAKAEAIKEVVEIMKPWYKLLCIDEGDWCHQLDALAYNLVKEMVGDAE